MGDKIHSQHIALGATPEEGILCVRGEWSQATDLGVNMHAMRGHENDMDGA